MNKFTLTGDHATIWLNGRSGFANTKKPAENTALEYLIKIGLAIKSSDYAIAEYRTLTQCTIVPADRKYPFFGLSGTEKTVLQWLREAGLVLSMAELVYLIDRNVPLEAKYFGSDNAQNLVEQIYTRDTIFDNILENQMERVAMRENTVNSKYVMVRHTLEGWCFHGMSKKN